MQAPAAVLQSGVLKCVVPSHAPGVVRLCITNGDGRPRSRLMAFEYRAAPSVPGSPQDRCVVLHLSPGRMPESILLDETLFM